MTRKGYNNESLARAFAHHVSTGAVRRAVPPMPANSTWVVDLAGEPTVRWSSAQAYAMCVGLAAGERNSRKALDAIHGMLDGQVWSADTLEAIAAVIASTGRVIREPQHTGVE